MIDPALAATALNTAASVVSSGLDALRGTDDTTPKKAPDVVDKSDFLNLLIAQLQNQDPLNPLDSANFSSQLAQFSSLEQLTQINQHLVDQAGGGTASRFEVLGLLGRDVRGVGSTIAVTDGHATSLAFDLAAAGNVRAQLVDGAGHVAANLDLGTLEAGAHTLDLTTIPEAPTLADGTYQVLLTSGDGTTSAPVQTFIDGRVTGVDLSGDSPVLLIGGVRLTLDDLREIEAATQS